MPRRVGVISRPRDHYDFAWTGSGDLADSAYFWGFGVRLPG
jgi:hypothetical protein